MQLLSLLFLVLYTLAIAGVMLVIITDNRSPLKSLAWIVVLLLAPVVGLFGYFFFGQDLSKRRLISRRMRRRIQTRLGQQAATDGARVPAQWQPLSALLRNTIEALPLDGSRITLYTDGRTKMESLREAIAGARHHIHLQYYIFDDDRTGCALRELLVRKAQEGVAVRILYDDVGCARVKRAFFEEMRRNGIEVRAFLPVQFPRFTSKVNYRNHRKLAVIDGCIGFLGGMNIADRYVDGPAWGGCWRDNHFRIEGGGVAALQASFLNDWSATTKQAVADAACYPPLPRFADGATLQLVASGPFGKWRALLQGESYAIANARRRIWIQTPYYLPSELLDATLQEAALAGRDVRLMLPERSDSTLVHLASHSFLDDMFRAGVKVSFYAPGFLHAKLLIVDDDLTVIGSANMDFRSFEHNFEANAFVYDRAFTARMAACFEEDERACRAVTPGEWFRRPRRRRLLESCMRLFAPLM